LYTPSREANGTSVGITPELGAEALLVPIALVAVTVNVYVVPFVNPVRIARKGPDVHVTGAVLGLDVIVYPVIGYIPSFAGADHVTEAEASKAKALTFVGTPGTVGDITHVTGDDAALAGPVPAVFVAVTLKVYDVPFVSPVTTATRGPDVHVAV
jgi:hypothetical protein